MANQNHAGKPAKVPEQAKKYIVSDYIFAEHDSYMDAEAERQRLRREHPGRIFHVYCVLQQFQNYEDIPL